MSNPRAQAPPTHRSPPNPAEIVLAMARQLTPVATETLDLPAAAGRVLAQQLVADRDSPAIDVSSMDGYAVRLADLRPGGVLPVRGSAEIGQPRIEQPVAAAARIVTGAPVPLGADAVVRREDVRELPEAIVLAPTPPPRLGQSIRRRGENATAGSVVLHPGVAISPPVMAASAGFGLRKVVVHRRVRVSVIVTGDELSPSDVPPHPWQLRDCNGTTLLAMLASLPWAHCAGLVHIRDDPDAIIAALREALAQADAVLLTGGVSKGDRDFVPFAVSRLGARCCFHGLPIRPGKPTLGAIAPDGQAILGLPGNAVSVMVTARRFALIVLRRLAGFAEPETPVAAVAVEADEAIDRNLWVYRPVRLVGPASAVLVPTRGSGDIVSAARSDGFVEIAPGSEREVRRPFFAWRPE